MAQKMGHSPETCKAMGRAASQDVKLQIESGVLKDQNWSSESFASSQDGIFGWLSNVWKKGIVATVAWKGVKFTGEFIGQLFESYLRVIWEFFES